MQHSGRWLNGSPLSRRLATVNLSTCCCTMSLVDCYRALFTCRMIDWLSTAVVFLERPPPTFLTVVPMTSRRQLTFRRRNPDSCSVFRSELIAINEGFELVQSEKDFEDLWILTDSKSCLQHLSNWYDVGDKSSISILTELKHISKNPEIYAQ
ncbi:RNase H domain-containing protein [Trichonephila clavipes]|nr:RNase H domain-containing protein [Trichonephila clavipes]